jgi:hypothetical protein
MIRLRGGEGSENTLLWLRLRVWVRGTLRVCSQLYMRVWTSFCCCDGFSKHCGRERQCSGKGLMRVRVDHRSRILSVIVGERVFMAGSCLGGSMSVFWVLGFTYKFKSRGRGVTFDDFIHPRVKSLSGIAEVIIRALRCTTNSIKIACNRRIEKMLMLLCTFSLPREKMKRKLTQKNSRGEGLLRRCVVRFRRRHRRAHIHRGVRGIGHTHQDTPPIRRRIAIPRVQDPDRYHLAGDKRRPFRQTRRSAHHHLRPRQRPANALPRPVLRRTLESGERRRLPFRHRGRERIRRVLRRSDDGGGENPAREGSGIGCGGGGIGGDTDGEEHGRDREGLRREGGHEGAGREHGSDVPRGGLEGGRGGGWGVRQGEKRVMTAGCGVVPPAPFCVVLRNDLG